MEVAGGENHLTGTEGGVRESPEILCQTVVLVKQMYTVVLIHLWLTPFRAELINNNTNES